MRGLPNRRPCSGATGPRAPCPKNKAPESRIARNYNHFTCIGAAVDKRSSGQLAGGYRAGQGFGTSNRGRASKQGDEWRRRDGSPSGGDRDAGQQQQQPRNPPYPTSGPGAPRTPGSSAALRQGSAGRGGGSGHGSGSRGDASGKGLHAHILAAKELRVLTELLTQPQPRPGDAAAAATADGEAAAAGPASVPPAGDNASGTDAGSPTGPARSPTREAAAAFGGQLSESELLLALWRLVCAELLQLTAVRPGDRTRPRPLPPQPPAATAALSPQADQWLQQLWPGHAPVGGHWVLQPLLASSGAASVPLPLPLVGSRMARQRCLEALTAAASRLAPGMGLGDVAAALQLLGRWAAELEEAEAGAGGPRGGGSGGDEVRRLAKPFLAAAAAVAAAGSCTSEELVALVAALPPLHRHCYPELNRSGSLSWSSRRKGGHKGGGAVAAAAVPGADSPLTHAALAAALCSLTGRAAVAIPSPSELCLCAAAAAACGCVPPPMWLALLKLELRKQLFLLTAPQGAIILASLEQLPLLQLPPPAKASGPGGQVDGAARQANGVVAADGGGAGVGGDVLLAEDWVAMLWAEVRGKAAALDPASAVEALQELAGYVLTGLLRPHPSPSPAALGHAAPPAPAPTGAGRVRHLAAGLLAQAAPLFLAENPSSSAAAAKLTAALTAAASLCEYEQKCGAAAAQPLQPDAPQPHPLVEPAARALLRRLRSGELTLPQLAACVQALATLVTTTPYTPSKASGAESWAPAPVSMAAATAATAAVTALLLELPGEVPRCVLGQPTEPLPSGGVAAAAKGSGGALGPEVLVWLLPLEGSLVALEDHVVLRMPLLRQLQLRKQQQQQLGEEQQPAPQHEHQGSEQAGYAGGEAACGSRGLAARVLSRVLVGLPQRGVAQLLQLAAAVQHPWTSSLFAESARRDVLLALLNSPPLPQAGTMAAAAALLPGAVQSLRGEALVDVMCAAARRQQRADEVWSELQQRRQRPAQRWPQQQLQLPPPADPVAAAALSASLGRLLDLALAAETQPGFMDGPRRPATAVLAAGRWGDALAALAQAAHALKATPSPPPGGGSGGSAPALTAATLRRLLVALQTVWPALSPSQAVAAFVQVVEMYEKTQIAGGRAHTRGSAEGDSGSGAASGSMAADAAEAPDAADWHVVQRALAAKMTGMTGREVAAMVTAEARLAAAPLCDEWMAALTNVLLGPLAEPPPKVAAAAAVGPPPLALAGGLAALTPDEALKLLRGCIELKAAPAAAGHDGVMLPVLPLLERLGIALLLQLPPPPPEAEAAPAAASGGSVSCSEICRLLPRVAQLATDPALAAALGTTCLPLLAFLQVRGFAGTRLGDTLSALQGLSRLLLRPEPDWATALCAATVPLLRNPAAALPDLAALAHAMAEAWLVPTPEWHGELMAATAEKMARGTATAAAASGSGGGRKEQALEQLLWAQAIWAKLSIDGDGGDGGSGAMVAPLAAPGGWLDAVAAASVPLLPQAAPAVLANMPYVFNSLGHDPGSDFIAALLQGCSGPPSPSSPSSQSVPSPRGLHRFTGPQLSRLAHGLAGLGYQPEDPWVSELQLAAAATLHECDPQELADLLEGVLQLEEGRGEAGGGGDGAGLEGGGTWASAAGGAGWEERRAKLLEELDHLDLDSELDSDLKLALDLGMLPSVELFLMGWWEAAAERLSRDALLCGEAVARQVRGKRRVGRRGLGRG